MSDFSLLLMAYIWYIKVLDMARLLLEFRESTNSACDQMLHSNVAMFPLILGQSKGRFSKKEKRDFEDEQYIGNCEKDSASIAELNYVDQFQKLGSNSVQAGGMTANRTDY